MPAPAHTPAPRRFLPKSNPSRSHLESSSAVHRTPFGRPSRSSSSPFVKTPHVQAPAGKDDIEASFEEEEQSPSVAWAPNNSRGTQVNKGDSIEDGGESTFGSFYDGPGANIDNSASQYSRMFERASTADQFSSPLPKRQKRNHERWSTQEITDVPSSPTPGNERNVHDQDYNTREADHVDDEASSPAEDEEARRAKFRYPTTARPSSTVPSGKPAFRSVFRNRSAGEQLGFDSPLPEAFSPSRKKGKQDYIYNGAAEQVRNWVLEIANEQSREVNETGNKLTATTTAQDRSGRFDLVEEDDSNKKWMMVRQQGRYVTPLMTNKIVKLRGKDTKWTLQLTDAEQLNVAVLWNTI